ncbi:MAG TPA: hypothetical protein VMC07_01410 [Candidatus Omnitrophota bacterium]|nr:hypothetical protein [Candidatus Omnitrophota bacterium]
MKPASSAKNAEISEENIKTPEAKMTAVEMELRDILERDAKIKEFSFRN